MTTSQEILAHRDFIIVSSINWSENWQIHQQLATLLVESGRRVLFIENTGVRAPRAGDFFRIYDRIRNWVKSTRGFVDVQKNLTVFSPIFIPFPYSKLALVINRFFISRSIEKWMKVEWYQSPVIISFLPTPLVQSLIDDIDRFLLIYYCADDMSGRGREARLTAFETTFFSKVDAVFCTSHTLLERASLFNNQTHFFPAGVDIRKFESVRVGGTIPEDLAVIQRPIVGFVGAINTAFDQILLAYAARALPTVSFILIGPEFTNVDLLRACPNVKLLGMRAHDDVPRYIKGFDVALIPSINSTTTDAIYSCKLNEYLAMGVQVVATDMRELRFYLDCHGSVLEVTRTKNEFVEKIRHAIDAPDDVNRSKRISAALANSWDQRFEEICVVIDQLLLTKSTGRLNWQNSLINYYRRGRLRILKMGLFLAGAYAILFYTPLLWLAGEMLVMREEPIRADAIVVFSGDGDPGYVSMSYQSRAQDALLLYRAGYSDRILLSSGKALVMSEAEVVKALLLEKGVPISAILTSGITPKSTEQNVRLSAAELNRAGYKKVNFVTAPYHSRRAHLTWKRLAPELDIHTVSVQDTPSNQIKWHTNYEIAKVIAYEYLVIVYYWWKGWI